MAELSVITSILAMTGLLVGLFSPRRSLWWYYGVPSRGAVLRIYLLVLLLSFLVHAVSKGV
ncbi:hypothetical protein [Pontibacter actiniarum]|uniref:Uncharacterized protein n=1 Tax=Pontibacter actiniarum TaxID=323450 RepID=A0A1X9YRH5_9BACT|nr:hypothetical protein [Pontibacter actiniarum]ARS35490.1 hypothetical protein CA264_08585 [Pontibacter actiniarum]